MHTLIVTAHPSSKGLTHSIAKTYKETKEAAGHTAKIIDLYSAEWKQDYLAFEDMREIAADPIRDASQAEITKADEIVLVFPMWWMGVPAVMKNWFDHTFSSGFAFQFDKTGKNHKLLTGKTGRIFITAGGPQYMYALAKPFVSVPLTQGLFGFCGVKNKSLDIFANRNTPVIDPVEPIFEKVKKRANS